MTDAAQGAPAELPHRERIRAEISELELQLAGNTQFASLENCALHIKYWRKREALASMAAGASETAKEAKDNYLILRQASEHCKDWQQRYDAAKKDAGIDKLDALEKQIADKMSASSDLEKLAVGAAKRKRGRPKRLKD